MVIDSPPTAVATITSASMGQRPVRPTLVSSFVSLFTSSWTDGLLRYRYGPRLRWDLLSDTSEQSALVSA